MGVCDSGDFCMVGVIPSLYRPLWSLPMTGFLFALMQMTNMSPLFLNLGEEVSSKVSSWVGEVIFGVDEVVFVLTVNRLDRGFRGPSPA